jgi:DNA repair exonuclease SbcCD nuclease subunit
MLTVLHAADLHLDSPCTGLSPEQSALRRRQLRQLPARLAQLAREKQADLALLPGDLFDGQRVCPETVEALTAALRDMGCPVFIAPGNHDFFHPRSPYAAAQWPDSVHIFSTAELTSVEVPALNCVVHGCAFTDAHREDDPLAGFTAPDDGKIHLVCVHGEVGQSGTYAPITPASLEHCGANYVALGHIHAASGLQTAGQVPWAYPGCPEGRGFDECGEKGALVVTVGGEVSVQFVPICQRQYRVQSVDVGEFSAALPSEPSPDLVRLVLTGESARTPDVKFLAAQAAERFFYAEVRDETTLPQDLWARSGEDSLTGLFLRQMKARLDTAEEGDRPRLLLCARFGLAALEGGEDVRP